MITLMSDFTPEQKEEIQKLLYNLKRMEGIVHTSPNRDQVERVQKEMRRMGEKLAAMLPGVDPNHVDPEDVKARLGLKAKEDSAVPGGKVRNEGPVLSVVDKYPIMKASPNCTDNDINFVNTVLKVIQNEYWPVLSDQICKLDFSSASERDSIRTRMDNVHRSLKVLTETIEEYAAAEKQDFREQLLKMKTRQGRVLMFEAVEYLRISKDFLARLVNDIRTNGGSIINKSETIHFDPMFHSARVLEGRTVSDGIKEFSAYVDQSIDRLHMPNLKTPGN